MTSPVTTMHSHEVPCCLSFSISRQQRLKNIDKHNESLTFRLPQKDNTAPVLRSAGRHKEPKLSHCPSEIQHVVRRLASWSAHSLNHGKYQLDTFGLLLKAETGTTKHHCGPEWNIFKSSMDSYISRRGSCIQFLQSGLNLPLHHLGQQMCLKCSNASESFHWDGHIYLMSLFQ